jgi:hypothetical protein
MRERDMSSSNADASGVDPDLRRRSLRLAYQRYLQRGGARRTSFDDWLEAERELKARRRANV